MEGQRVRSPLRLRQIGTLILHNFLIQITNFIQSIFGLLHKDLRRVVGIHKSLVVKIPISHIVVHPTALGKNLHVSVVLSHLLYQIAQQTDKSVTAAVLKPQFEVTIPRQQILIGWGTSL